MHSLILWRSARDKRNLKKKKKIFPPALCVSFQMAAADRDQAEPGKGQLLERLGKTYCEENIYNHPPPPF